MGERTLLFAQKTGTKVAVDFLRFGETLSALGVLVAKLPLENFNRRELFHEASLRDRVFLHQHSTGYRWIKKMISS